VISAAADSIRLRRVVARTPLFRYIALYRLFDGRQQRSPAMAPRKAMDHDLFPWVPPEDDPLPVAAFLNRADDAVTRRQLIKRSALGAVVLGSAGLTACGSSSTAGSSSSTHSAAATPKRGGVLRAGIAGGSASDTLDANNPVSVMDNCRVRQLYDPLTTIDVDGQIRNVLASEFTPNAKATAWDVRIRPDVVFHNGKPLTADDILFTLRRIMNPKAPLYGASALASLDVAGMKKLDSHTVRLPFKAPNSALPSLIYDVMMVPEGYDPRRPIGTGPFAYRSFTPGQQSVFLRNPHYWQNGLPYVDQLVITDYSDETSQVNALLAGQVDAVDQLSVASIETLKASGQRTITSDSGSFNPFTMRVDIPPFNDVRVRQAMKLVFNRTQIRDAVFGPSGLIGNDLYSPFDPVYDRSIPQRAQDIEQAKSLLKAAGREDLSVEIVTAAVGPGLINQAQEFSRQAQAAGVTIQIKTLTPTAWFKGYLSYPLSQSVYYTEGFLWQTVFSQLPNSPFNESHYNNPRFNKLYAQALAATEPSTQTEIMHAMQQLFWNDGGYIIPNFNPLFDAVGHKLMGVMPSKRLWLYNYGFKSFWLA
jgi:peptide/nickel transport system substrate-binding protein